MDSVSVIIPLYNKAPHLVRGLQSVLRQTVAADEIIIVDDGSTDGGADLIRSFSDPRIVLIQQTNQGVSAARNRGVAAAKGELIAFFDPDDAWKPGYLEEILHLRQEYPQAGIYATAYEIVDPQGSLMRQKFNVLPPGSNQGMIKNYFKLALNRPEPLLTSAVTVPKKILQEINGFQVNEYLGQDVDAWLKIALRYPIAWSRERLMIYFMNVVNSSVAKNLFKREPAISRTAREALAAGLVAPDEINDLREYVAYFQVGAAVHLLMQGDNKMAKEMLGYAKGTRRFAGKWWECRALAALPAHLAPFLLRAYRRIITIM